MVRGAQPGVSGPAPGRLGARDFFEAAQGETGGARRGGEAEDPGRAGRQVRAVRLRADGRLRADHVVPVRQAFASGQGGQEDACGGCGCVTDADEGPGVGIFISVCVLWNC